MEQEQPKQSFQRITSERHLNLRKLMTHCFTNKQNYQKPCTKALLTNPSKNKKS